MGHGVFRQPYDQSPYATSSQPSPPPIPLDGAQPPSSSSSLKLPHYSQINPLPIPKSQFCPWPTANPPPLHLLSQFGRCRRGGGCRSTGRLRISLTTPPWFAVITTTPFAINAAPVTVTTSFFSVTNVIKLTTCCVFALSLFVFLLVLGTVLPAPIIGRRLEVCTPIDSIYLFVYTHCVNAWIMRF